MNSSERSLDRLDSFRVSVVIPYFNDAKTIARALESVRNQTFQPLETLLVDDASRPDQFQKLCSIVREFHDLKIQVIRQPDNQGPSAARNSAWNLARGTYLAFLDSDDAWHPDKLASQKETLERDPALRVIGTRAQQGDDIPETTDHPTDETRVSARSQLFRNHFVTSSVLLRRDIPFRFREDLRYSEDNDLWCRVLLHHQDGGVVLQKSLSFYYKPPLSRVGASGRFWRMFRGQVEVYTSLRRDGLITKTTLGLCLSSCTVRFAIRLARVAWSTLPRVLPREEKML